MTWRDPPLDRSTASNATAAPADPTRAYGGVWWTQGGVGEMLGWRFWGQGLGGRKREFLRLRPQQRSHFLGEPRLRSSFLLCRRGQTAKQSKAAASPPFPLTTAVHPPPPKTQQTTTTTTMRRSSASSDYIGLGGAQGAGIAAFVTTVVGYTLVYVSER